MKKTLIIIGAGPAGLAAALEAKKNNFKVIILEKKNKPGGKGASDKYKEFIFDYGPHAFHATTKEISDCITNYAGQNLLELDVKQSLYITEKEMKYPFSITYIKYLSFKLNINIFIDFFVSIFKSLILKPKIKSFKDFGELRFGKTLHNLCFGNYTKRVLGYDTDLLSVEYAKRKLPSVSILDFLIKLIFKTKKENQSYLNVRRYIYHKYGMGKIFESMAKDISKDGDEIIYNCEIEKFIFKKDTEIAGIQIKSPEQKIINCDYIFSSCPLDELMTYSNIDIEYEKNKLPQLEYKNVVIVNVILNKKKFSNNHWIYLVNEKFYFNRLSEQKNFSKYCTPEDKTVLMFEKIVNFNDVEWKFKKKDWMKKVLNDLSFFGIQENEIDDIVINNIEKAYPIFFVDFEKTLKEIYSKLSKFKNLISSGRYGLYLDINMHDSMFLGKKSIKYLLDNNSENYYQDYQKIIEKK